MENCKFDDKFKEEVEEELKGVEGPRDENADEYLNYDITIEETEAVLQFLKKNKAPGPDEVYSDLLKLAWEEMLKAIHSLFQKSWRDGKVPDRWREAEVKFLRKEDLSRARLITPYQLDECPLQVYGKNHCTQTLWFC